MDVYRVTLFGHRDFCPTKNIEEELTSILKKLMLSERYLEIYIGRNGEFDIFVATVVKRLQKTMGKDNCAMILVLPYAVKDVGYYEKYYDDIIIPECVANIPPKAAITARNRWMLDESDLLICCVQRNSGGAYKAMKYAEQIGLETIRIN